MKGFYDAYDDSLDIECPDCETVMSGDECENCGFKAPAVDDLDVTDEDYDRLLSLRGTLL